MLRWRYVVIMLCSATLSCCYAVIMLCGCYDVMLCYVILRYVVLRYVVMRLCCYVVMLLCCYVVMVLCCYVALLLCRYVVVMTLCFAPLLCCYVKGLDGESEPPLARRPQQRNLHCPSRTPHIT